jgi:hypothetical protein
MLLVILLLQSVMQLELMLVKKLIGLMKWILLQQLESMMGMKSYHMKKLYELML